jgi:hypothetical protein
MVLNSAHEGNWSHEDRHAVNLKRNQFFGMIILITE